MQWDYDVVCRPLEPTVESDLAEILNTWGQSGWELVSAAPTRMEGEDWVLMIFKRPSRDGQQGDMK
jgi:hypothetical protein